MLAPDLATVNELLSLVIAGHLIGDWIFQTDHQAMTKMQGGKAGFAAMAAHVYSYTIAMFVTTSWAFAVHNGTFFDYRSGLYILLGVSAATHWLIDLRWPVRWLMRVTGSPNFSKSEWGVIATDQALHLSILCILVAILGR